MPAIASVPVASPLRGSSSVGTSCSSRCVSKFWKRRSVSWKETVFASAKPRSPWSADWPTRTSARRIWKSETSVVIAIE